METVRNALAASIRGGLTHDEPDADEIERRRKLKAAFLDIIEGIDKGIFTAAVVTQLIPNKWPQEYATQMYGDLDIVKMQSAQVIAYYAQKKKGKQATQDDEVALMLPPEPQLFVPGE